MDDMNTKQMNPTKERNGDLCEIAMHCCSKGSSSLSNFPGLMKEIIETKAWERREWRGKVFELPSLLDLITRKPLEGWGEDPDKIEALIESDPEALSMWRKETTRANHRPLKSNDNIITSSKAKQGTGKAYTLDRLSKENPDLYQSVVNGDLSANAAAIAAGWRKKTVTVTDDPSSAAKTLREKFGDEWFKKLIQEATAPTVDSENAKLTYLKCNYKGVNTKDVLGYFERLKEDIKENGCAEPLIVQHGTNILVDGHKRLAICKELGIPYQVQTMHFDSQEDVEKFITRTYIERFRSEFEGPLEEFEDGEKGCKRARSYIDKVQAEYFLREANRRMTGRIDRPKLAKHVQEITSFKNLKP
jgi:hypothetical protein